MSDPETSSHTIFVSGSRAKVELRRDPNGWMIESVQIADQRAVRGLVHRFDKPEAALDWIRSQMHRK